VTRGPHPGRHRGGPQAPAAAASSAATGATSRCMRRPSTPGWRPPGCASTRISVAVFPVPVPPSGRVDAVCVESPDLTTPNPATTSAQCRPSPRW